MANKQINNITIPGLNGSEVTYDLISVNEGQILTDAKSYTDTKVAALVNGAPETLDTLDELAAALKDNKDIVDTLNAAIGSKADKNNTATVVKEINAGSGSFTPTTKYLHKTTTSVAPNAHTHSVTVSGTTGANSGNAVTAVTSVGTLTPGSGSLTSVATQGTGDITYVESVTHTAATLNGTTSFNTDAIKDVTLSASTTTTAGPKYVESVTHTAATLSGTTSFNTNAIKDFTLSASDTTTAGPKYVESISGNAPSLTGTKTFVTGYNSFSGGSGDLVSNDTPSGGIPYIAVASYDSTNRKLTLTTKYLHHTHTAATLGAASTGTVGISGGSYSATTKYMAHSNTAADKGTISINGGSITPVTKYMAHSNTAASTASVGISGGSITPNTKYLHHTHTGASLSGTTTASVAPSNHTHSYSGTHTSGANSGNAVSAITGLTANTTAATGDITYIESATHTHTGASVKSTETVIKSADSN